jgi:hypothetical protein
MERNERLGGMLLMERTQTINIAILVAEKPRL